jgi:hypothetical protein
MSRLISSSAGPKSVSWTAHAAVCPLLAVCEADRMMPSVCVCRCAARFLLADRLAPEALRPLASQLLLFGDPLSAVAVCWRLPGCAPPQRLYRNPSLLGGAGDRGPRCTEQSTRTPRLWCLACGGPNHRQSNHPVRRQHHCTRDGQRRGRGPRRVLHRQGGPGGRTEQALHPTRGRIFGPGRSALRL